MPQLPILQVKMRTIGRIDQKKKNFCKQCIVCFETKEELDTHVWQIHQFKIVKCLFWGFCGCVLGGILGDILGGFLGGILGALGSIFWASFFAREEDLNKNQRKIIPMSQWHKSAHKNTGSEWKVKKTRKMKNRKRKN